MAGRGAWSTKGRGGTLKRLKDGSTPAGPYYLLAVKPTLLVGAAARNALRAGTKPSLDDLAVHYGVRAIQRLLNLAGQSMVADGVLGKGTDAGIRAYQEVQVLTVDGSAGPKTMGRLLVPHIKRLGKEHWTTVYGLLKNEGAFDPGAVGTVDEDDLGLAQINGRAHPDMTVDERFDPLVAIQFNVDYLRNALAALGNVRDAVLAYNLGIGGVRVWIKAGRPRLYSPDGGPLRDTTQYVDRVLNAYKELS